MHRQILIPALALTATVVWTTLAAPLDQWHWRCPLPQGNRLHSVACVNGLYVAAGELGTILTSVDGTNWTRRDTVTDANLRDCAFGAGRYVVVGDYGTVLTSPDAQTWTAQYPGTFFSLNAITYVDGQFVAVGDATTIITSSDAVTWTAHSSGPWELFDVIYEEDTWVAVGGAIGSANTPAAGVILISTDGISWSRRTPVLDSPFLSIAYGAGVFAAAVQSSYFQPHAIWTSDDGRDWQPQSISIPPWPLQTLAYGGGTWVLASGYGYNPYFGSGQILISTDLQNWSSAISNTITVSGLVFGNGRFIASRTDGTFLVSSEGTDWTNPAKDCSPQSIYDLQYVNGSFIAAAGNQLLSSQDGINWTNTTTLDDVYLRAIAYGNDRYVVVDGEGAIWTSGDAIGWTNSTPKLEDQSSPGRVVDVTFGNGLFVALTEYTSRVFTSADGLDWSVFPLPMTTQDYTYFRALTFGGGRFVAVGVQTLASSLDGTNWHILPTNYISMSQITWGKGRFVAVGHNAIMSTTDGTNWISQTSPAPGLSSVTFGGGFFVAASTYDYSSRYESPILVSNDGLNWSPRRSQTTRQLLSIAFGNGTFVIGGAGGAILQSDPVVNLTVQMQPQPQLTVSGPHGRSYRIECADTPSSEWQPLVTIFAEGTSAAILDAEPRTTPNRFYRAVLLP